MRARNMLLPHTSTASQPRASMLPGHATLTGKTETGEPTCSHVAGASPHVMPLSAAMHDCTHQSKTRCRPSLCNHATSIIAESEAKADIATAECATFEAGRQT